ncbi:MAG TPA: M56 family metallopeptidase [Verrucomicrobiae bacterium]|nr:M56 family metallopeptidase [Verrucomicrobiae bacterium]
MTPALARATSSFLTYLAEPAVRSLLVGSAAAVALVALRLKRAPARLQVWTAVLCAALAMPLLGVMLPKMPLAIPASTVARISERVPMRKNSSEWSVLSAQQKAVARGESAEIRQFGANNSRLGRASERSAKVKANVAQVFRPGGLSGVRRVSEAKSLTPKGVSYVEGAKGSTRDAWRATAAWTTEKPQVSSDGRRIGTGPELQAFGVPAEMPVMPLPVVSVVAAPGISIAQTAAAMGLAIYAFVALILLARLFAGMWFSGKLERAAQEVEPLYFSGAGDAQNAQAREAVRVLRYRSSLAGVKNAPALKESAAISVPATVGVRRAAILLPLNWRAWSGEQLDAVLAHEVAHVARRDALVQTLSLVHRAIFWFSPLAWWLDRQLTELAEQASDEAALAGGADRTRYAETLLGFFAQLESASGRIWWQGVSMAKKSHAGRAERRVDRILAWKEGMPIKKSFALVVAALAMPVILLAASLHPVIAYGQDNAQSEDQNVIMPGGPKAPALPKAPKGGVVAPAIPAAPQGGLQGGVPTVPAVAPAPRGGVPMPAIVAAPVTAASSQGVDAPASTPASPPQGGIRGGVAAPAIPAARQGGVPTVPAMAPAPNPVLAPRGPMTVHPSAQASVAPMASESSVASLAPAALLPAPAAQLADDRFHAGAGVGSGTGVGIGMLHERELQEIEARLQASLDELQRADADSTAASTKEAAAAFQEIERAKESPDAADYDQMLAAQHAIEKARRLMEQSDASQVREAQRALAEALRDLHEAQQHQALMRAHRAEEMSQHAAEMAQRGQAVNQRVAELADRQAQRAQEINERNQEMAERAARSAEDPQERSTRNVTINGGSYTMGGGPRYVVLTGPNETVEMAGDDEDLHHAEGLRKKFGKDLIWFERDEKSYVITDPAFIAKAKALFAPEEELSKQQDELGRQQDELGRQQDALGEQMDKVSVKPPDVSEDLQRIQARLKELQATGATQSELGEIQSELGRLQSRVGRVQSEAGAQQSVIGRQQGELGRKQGELGRKQGELGRRQGEIAREASRQLRGMFDDAIAKGIAKPE